MSAGVAVADRTEGPPKDSEDKDEEEEEEEEAATTVEAISRVGACSTGIMRGVATRAVSGRNI
jgi:hypothetical protein